MRSIFTILSIGFLLLSINVHGQQGNNWYFGYQAGVTFNTTPPTVLLNGVQDFDEGCATISDNNGQLLFFSDGVKVYNRLHQVMPNGDGLMGHRSSSNSAIVIPQPGSPSIYYIFTADAVENSLNNGYRYSIVDMTLNGGLGDVTSKNVLLYAKCNERLTATLHSNGIDVWIITKEWNSNGFRVYRLGCAGLNPVPVVSFAGIPTVTVSGIFDDAVGCSKVSPDGKKLASTRTFRKGWEIFDFNNTTGVVYNPIFIPLNLDRVYGVEFSPDSRLIYLASECCAPLPSGQNSSIHQYKVDIHDSATIKNSMYTVVDSIQNYISALQLGPDNKIYATHTSGNFLHTINSPNTYGPGCSFSPYAINLSPGRLARRGLPVFYYNAILNQNVDFSFTIQPDCRTVIFSGTTTFPPPVTWSWDFGDGNTGTGQNITHVFPATGNSFNVTLTVTNPTVCGATGTRMKNINFNRIPPDADFSFTTACGNQTVTFNDLSTIPPPAFIIAWLWEFGDGQTSTQQNPSHTYPAFGQYTTRLTVTSSDGCLTQDTISKLIAISPKPVAAFSFDKGCLDIPVQFTDGSTISSGTINQWYWEFGDGQTSTLQNPQHTYSVNGPYIVSLVAYAAGTGCPSDTTRITLTITAKPIALFSYQPGCLNSPVSFTDNSTIASGTITAWYWDFGNGSSSTNQNASTTYALTGPFNVKHVAISESNCVSDTASAIIIIENKPNAAFSYITNCGSRSVQFTDNSTPTAGAITSWYWNFGDGTNSSAQNPVHAYTNFGNYSIKFTSATANGCWADTIYRNIIVADKPVVNFILPPVCLLDATANFLNSTTIGDNSSLSYFWDFGDFNAIPPGSDTSILTNPQYQYTAAANYNVKLIARSSYGCSDSITRTITVNGAVPRADFRVLNSLALCSNADVSIKDSSTVDFGNITKLRIFWGDGDSTIDNNPSQAPNGGTYNHRYPYFGTPATRNYTITMYSYSGTVCVDMTTRNIVLYASPQIQFNPLNETCHEVAPFNITPASEIWGLPGTGSYSGTGIINAVAGTFSPQVADTGNHVITYTFITPQGCRADSSRILRVNPTPRSLFSFNNACLPTAQVQFNNQSSVPYYNLNQMQYLWNFNDPNSTPGNPNSSVNINPVHNFTSLDTFRVSLFVTSPKGCIKDTIIRLIRDVNIYPQPIARFKFDSSKLFCQGTPVTFINISDSMNKPLIKWWWNFGDGAQDSVNRRPSHLYAGSGIYTATLQVQNANGCISQIDSKPVLLESIPVADFIFDTTCFGRPIQFTDRSTNVFGNMTTWLWDFDDGNSSSFQNPLHTYNNYNIYKVKLVTGTSNNCLSGPVTKDVFIRRVIISAGRDTTVAAGQPVQLQANGALTYVWSPATGLNNPTISNPVTTLQREQDYVITGITQAGCIGYDTMKVIVFAKADMYVPTAFTPNNDGKNDRIGPICIGMKNIDFFTIYNRSGQVVFTTRTMNGSWDGRIQGIEQPTSVFVWMARGITFDGRIIEKKGTLTLIR